MARRAINLGRERELERLQPLLERQGQLRSESEQVKCRQPGSLPKFSLLHSPVFMRGLCF